MEPQSQFETDVRHFLDELFISKPGEEEWSGSEFLREQGQKLFDNLQEAGHEGVVLELSVSPHDDATTPDNEAEQIAVVAKANEEADVEIILDFKSQVNFTGDAVSVTFD